MAQPKKQCGEKGGDKPLAGRSGERRGGMRPTVLRDSLMRYSQHERGSKHHRQEVFHLAQRVNDIVLVHGGFVDGSGWAGVYRILENDGFNVSIVQNPTLSLEGDVGATKLIIDQQPGDVILVGHSYGGAVITQAGTHKKVAGLVYITAFAPDAGESVNTLIANPPPGAPVPPILPPLAATSSWTRKSSRPHLQATWMPPPRSSWRFRRFRGGWRRSAAPLRFRHGRASRVGICLLATTK